MIGPTWAKCAGNRSVREGGLMHKLEQIKHELADLSGSQAIAATVLVPTYKKT